MNQLKWILLTALTLTGIAAQAVTDLQIQNAKKAAYDLVEKIAREREPVVLVARPGWRLTSLNTSKEKPFMDYTVTPIQIYRPVNRIAVRMYLNAVSPDGKIDWVFGGSYRVLVDLKDDGEVIAAEINYFSNLMSYEDPAPVRPSHE